MRHAIPYLRLIATLAALVVAVCATTAASAQGAASAGTFPNLAAGGGAAPEEVKAPTTASRTVSPSSGAVAPSLLISIFVVAGLLLAGIAYHIVHDARSVAPVGETLGGGGGSGSSRERTARARKRRARAKAARRQRRHNR